MPQHAFKFQADVGPDGKVELNLPLPPGTHVEVLVLTPDTEQFDDLVHAATSSTNFWDNPWDQEDWDIA